jgi:DNA-binding protein HU-beta
MNKEELVRAVSSRIDFDLRQDRVTKLINITFKEITRALNKGDKVALIGFGTFSVAKRPARNGRNPKTGVSIQIPAKGAPKFTAGKELRKAVKDIHD